MSDHADIVRKIGEAYEHCIETDNWPEGFDPFDAIGDLLNIAHDFQRHVERLIEPKLLVRAEAAEAEVQRLRELIADFKDHIEDIGRPGHLARQDALLDRIEMVRRRKLLWSRLQVGFASGAAAVCLSGLLYLAVMAS